jgi:hypothetical protein
MISWEFTRARAYVRKLRLRTAHEYFEWCAGRLPGFPKKPDGVPANPHQVYAGEWAGFPDWLDTENTASFLREWAPFAYARDFVRSLELASSKEWNLYAAGRSPALGTRPLWLPSNPNLAYRGEGWAGMRDWLGIGDKVAPRGSAMRSFEDARKFARNLGLKTWGEWRVYVAGNRPDLPPKPVDVPSVPQACYRTNGWITWADFLGGDKTAWHQVTWREFNSAREFARNLGLSSSKQWRAWIKSGMKPADIPSNPEKAYAGLWLGWSDWLGNRRDLPIRFLREPRFPPLLHSSRIIRTPK